MQHIILITIIFHDSDLKLFPCKAVWKTIFSFLSSYFCCLAQLFKHHTDPGKAQMAKADREQVFESGETPPASAFLGSSLLWRGYAIRMENTWCKLGFSVHGMIGIIPSQPGSRGSQKQTHKQKLNTENNTKH